jgi:hypothetical protein
MGLRQFGCMILTLNQAVAYRTHSHRLLWLWTLEHRRDLNVQDFANFKKACRTDAVLADFILLNLLLRDAYRLRELRLEHFEC